MVCVHGYIDDSTCPECSRLTNVKPFKRVTTISFTELDVEQSPFIINEGTSDSQQENGGKEIPIESLKAKRMLVDEGPESMYPTNSGYLHSRLKQIDFLTSERVPDDAIDQRVRKIRKRESINRQAKDE